MVTRLQGYRVTRVHIYKVTRLQGCKVAIQGYKVAIQGYKGYTDTGLKSYTELNGYRVTQLKDKRLQGYKVIVFRVKITKLCHVIFLRRNYIQPLLKTY